MKAFVYQAALYCVPCGESIRARLDGDGKRPADLDNESSFDSDNYPKGPYADGGGEADSPQHCDACNAFLENPLTADGAEYLAEQISEAMVEIFQGRRSPIELDSAIGQWLNHYDVSCVVRTGFDQEAEISANEIVRDPCL
jgi:hypothetical protein